MYWISLGMSGLWGGRGRGASFLLPGCPTTQHDAVLFVALMRHTPAHPSGQGQFSACMEMKGGRELVLSFFQVD